MRNNTDRFVEAQVEYKTRTDDAVLISQNNEEIWIPRSILDWQTDHIIDELERGDELRMKLREWFANKKGLDHD